MRKIVVIQSRLTGEEPGLPHDKRGGVLEPVLRDLVRWSEWVRQPWGWLRTGSVAVSGPVAEALDAENPCVGRYQRGGSQGFWARAAVGTKLKPVAHAGRCYRLRKG